MECSEWIQGADQGPSAQETLGAIRVPVMNLHSGITPKCRGQVGGYWALVNGDPDHAGVTVHLVDAGVDTGDVICQARFEPGLPSKLRYHPARWADLAQGPQVGIWQGFQRVS
ncbi:formyltransferase family protein [Geothrix mesophila]|uniref:formyltransferase family protein n=1 Tax=Geothrix mesophila TaxID=2922723 RepID=UPI0024361115|nr:formyltransferase family protein [Geothrix sp. SG198]